jgi:ankyrin repeat protein
MDARFQPAINALKAGDLDRFRALLEEDPGLATARSSCSHPTLLQCLVLEAGTAPNQVELIQALIAADAEIDEPLVAAASMDNAVAAAALLDAGAAIDGRGGWSPLEEALYWSNHAVRDLLLARGAAIRNLRSAAGLGRTDLIAGFFDADGALKPEAGGIDWPFGDGLTSNHPSPIKNELRAKIEGWSRTPQAVLNNAFVYACMHGQIEAAKLFLGKGAEINIIPPGFDFAGTGLHYAALNGHREMAEFLLTRGADPSLRDPKVNSTPAGWADYSGHRELAKYLEGIAAPSIGDVQLT